MWPCVKWYTVNMRFKPGHQSDDLFSAANGCGVLLFHTGDRSAFAKCNDNSRDTCNTLSPNKMATILQSLCNLIYFEAFDSRRTLCWLVVYCEITLKILFNTLGPRQHGRHIVDDTFKRIFLNETVRISIKISLKSVPKGPINNIPTLVQMMAWHRPGDKPLSELMMIS